MSDLTAIVEQSMNAADPAVSDGGDAPEADAGGDAEVVDTPEVAAGAEGEDAKLDVAPAAEPVDKIETEVKAEAPKKPEVEPDELDKILDQYGIKGPRKGQREGSFTYTRFRKVLGTEMKKAAEKFEGDIKPLKERTTQIEAVEKLIANDGERYIRMLAAVYPQYRKYLEPQAAPKAEAAKPAAPAADPNDPMPQPDAKFADGTTGYSPEGFHKYQEWRDRKVSAQIRADMQKEFDARLSPFEQRQRADEARAAEMPRVQATIRKMAEKWGDIFINDVGDTSKPNPNSALMKYMRENPGMTVHEAALDVYLPLREKAAQEKLDKQRGEIHKELNARPGAADRGAGAGGEKTTRVKANQSLEDIVREAMAAADR